MRNTFLTISSLYFEIKYCTPESPAKPILLIFVSSLRAVEKKILTVNDYTRLINLTSYYSSFLEGDWDYLKLKLSHLLWNCLDMDQFVSSMSHFSSKVHESVRGWAFSFALSFSQQIFIQDRFCAGSCRQTMGEQDTEPVSMPSSFCSRGKAF